MIVLDQLRRASRVVTSSLTVIECARGIIRAAELKRITRIDELAALRLLDMEETKWNVHDMSDQVVARARGRFPIEPVRSLDALHLATALIVQESVGNIVMLSLDERMRQNAEALGFELSPNLK